MAIVRGDPVRFVPGIVDSLVKAASNDPYGDALYGERQHRDGWGFLLLGFGGSRRVVYYRSLRPIFEDSATEVVAQALSGLDAGSTVVLMIHARAASTNTPINIPSTHPVMYVTRAGSELYMIHNGSFMKDLIVRELGVDGGFASRFNDTYIANMALAQRLGVDDVDRDALSWLLGRVKTGANLGLALVGGQFVNVVVGSYYRLLGDGKDGVRSTYYKFYRCSVPGGVLYASSTVIDYYRPQFVGDCWVLGNGEYHSYRVDFRGEFTEPMVWRFT